MYKFVYTDKRNGVQTGERLTIARQESPFTIYQEAKLINHEIAMAPNAKIALGCWDGSEPLTVVFDKRANTTGEWKFISE